MSKLLVIAIAVMVVVWLLRRAIAGPPPAPPANPSPEGTPQGDLVGCAHCGVNLPKSEAYAAGGGPRGDGGAHYCSEEHRRLGPRGR